LRGSSANATPTSRSRCIRAGATSPRGAATAGRPAETLADPAERARARVELTVVSVLLDAGAGATWRYREAGTGAVLARSEGLAVASLEAYAAGAFSADPREPFRVDAERLAALGDDDLATLFQVTRDNPLAGLAGRRALLGRLGRVAQAEPAVFGAERARIGTLYDHLAGKARKGRLWADHVLETVLWVFAEIWPGRLTLGGANLGDVWRHDAVRADDASDRLVPFHKLSQWLTYSLIEPLEEAGVAVGGLDRLTGLAEYRNGGLLLDLGVVTPRDAGVLGASFPPDHPVIVEWRALTVALIDRLAPLVRARLGVGAESLPLVRLLEGGTWAAGRRLAAERRPGAAPPIRLASDGTVL